MSISIVITTVIGLILGDVEYNGIFDLPPSLTTVVCTENGVY
ncbi:hypothetical protein [Photorhabdus viridis]